MGDDYAIEKDGYRVVIAKEKDGKRWILTAFDNNKKREIIICQYPWNPY